ncbi:MAG: FKBP-type peptidyl-prolyl cis-trans isomerase [Sphingomicrobium sp.]
MNKIIIAALLPLAASACATVPVPPDTAAGPEFMLRNAKARHVVTTPSGLEYFILASGPATGVPTKDGDIVTFNYEGKLTDGTTFDSSFERGEPLVGGVGDFVPGFTQALKLMRPGDEWLVWIPPELGYGSADKGPIPANSVLRFRLQLISVAAPPAGG